MANYTIQLKTVMEGLTGKTSPVGFQGMDQLVLDAIPMIFQKFPIYSESHRVELEKMILNHYMFREICDTPVSKWLFMINRKLNEIMPAYNMMYEILDNGVNLFSNVDYTKTGNEDQSGNQTENETRTENRTETDSETSKKDATRDITREETHNDSHTTDTTVTNDLTQTTTGTDNTSTSATGDSTVDVTGSNSQSSTTDGTNGKTGNNVDKTDSQVLTVSSSDNNGLETQSNTPSVSLDAFTANKYMTGARKTSGNQSGNNTVTDKGSVTHTIKEDGTDHSETESSGSNTSKTTDKSTGSSTSDRDYSDTVKNTGTVVTGVQGTEIQAHDTTSKDTFTEDGKRDASKTGQNQIEGSKTGDTKSEREYVEHVVGKQGGLSYLEMMAQYKQELMSIDMRIVEDLEECFFGIY